VSRLWTSELRLNLRTSDCFAELLSPGWPRRLQASVSASGRGGAAIEAALSALELTDTHLLPADARLTVADEYVHYHLILHTCRQSSARALAQQHFQQTFDHADLQLQLSRLPGRGNWLAAAMTRHDLQVWRQALSQRGIRLRHLHPALAEDLRRLLPLLDEPEAILALPREQGLMLVRVVHQQPGVIEWLGLDLRSRSALEAGLLDFARRQPGSGRLPILLQTDAGTGLQRYLWDESQPEQLQTPLTQAVPAAGSEAASPTAPLLPALTLGLQQAWQRLLTLIPPPPTLQMAVQDSGLGLSRPSEFSLDPWINTVPTPEWQPEIRPALSDHLAQRRQRVSE
jgi:hypothetical protein